MKHPYLVSGLFAVLSAAVAGTLVLSGVPRSAEADSEAFRCTDSSFYFPTDGIIGWTYHDPDSTDLDADGHRTEHTGVDVFANDGPGAPVYAPADGTVSRTYGPERANIVLTGVINVLTGDPGIEVYLSHMNHTLVPGQTFVAGEVIGTQAGDHVHLSVGAFIGYDDRVITQTQDPSPYFNAALGYQSEYLEREHASFWCYPGSEPATLALAATEAPAESAAPAEKLVPQVHVVVEGDTLSGIAEQYSTTVEELAAANGLGDLDFLSLGQELSIPGTAVIGNPAEDIAPADAPPPAAVTAAASSGSYVVVEGDTLSTIAEEFGTDVETLMDLNALTDPDFLSIGDELILP